MTEFVFRGPVIKLPDNIDTDQIYPGRFLDQSDPSVVGSHCLEGVSPEVKNRVRKGAVIVAGSNFGCGSSREHAPIALINSGISLVIADSFARIFYRNSLNLGFPLLVCKGLSGHVSDEDIIEVNIETAEIKNLSTGETYQGESVGDFALDMLRAGGLKQVYRRRIAGETEGSQR